MHSYRRHIGRWFLVIVISACALAVGCDKAVDRKALQGEVTLDGELLSEATISFRPLPGTKGPTAGAEVMDGKYLVDAKGGTFVGEFRVEITATRKTGRQVEDLINGVMVDEYEQYLPARYNTESELTVAVTEAGPNEFPFQLDSE